MPAKRAYGIIGQPWRIRHLDEVLGHICAHQGGLEGRRQPDHRLVQVARGVTEKFQFGTHYHVIPAEAGSCLGRGSRPPPGRRFGYGIRTSSSAGERR
jgi:hypothetical protein